jgi:hypothetical protein
VSAITPSWALTYDSLTSSVLEYLERSDAAVAAYLPTAITFAEFDLAQELKTLGQLGVADAVLSVGNPILQKPARWRKTVSMTISVAGQKVPLLLRKLEYLNQYAQSVSALAPPVYYADYDYDHWMLAPTPDQAYPIETLVYSRVAPLSSTNQTNWFTRNAPNALLLGTLKHVTLFLKNDQRLQTVVPLYEKAVAALKTEDALRIADRTAIAVDS